MVTPRSIALSTCGILFSSIKRDLFGKLLVSILIIQHLQQEIGSCQSLAHLTNLFKYSLMLVGEFNDSVASLEYSFTSSAKCLSITASSETSGKSLM